MIEWKKKFLSNNFLFNLPVNPQFSLYSNHLPTKHRKIQPLTNEVFLIINMVMNICILIIKGLTSQPIV